jgi:hypothetical protein
LAAVLVERIVHAGVGQGVPGSDDAVHAADSLQVQFAGASLSIATGDAKLL